MEFSFSFKLKNKLSNFEKIQFTSTILYKIDLSFSIKLKELNRYVFEEYKNEREARWSNRATRMRPRRGQIFLILFHSKKLTLLFNRIDLFYTEILVKYDIEAFHIRKPQAITITRRKFPLFRRNNLDIEYMNTITISTTKMFWKEKNLYTILPFPFVTFWNTCHFLVLIRAFWTSIKFTLRGGGLKYLNFYFCILKFFF